MAPARTSYRMARLAAIVMGGLIGLTIAFLAGRSSASEVAPADGSLRSHSTDASRTPEGAVAAYLNQQSQLADPALWLAAPARRANELDEILASATVRRSVEQSIKTAIGRGDALGRALRLDQAVMARSAALGYRVISYSPGRAVVDAWVFSLLGAEGIPLDLRLARYRATERWISGAWRLGETRTLGEGSAVRFRGAPALSLRLTQELERFRTVSGAP